MNITAKDRKGEIVASSATISFGTYEEAKDFAINWTRKTMRGHDGPSNSNLSVTVYDLSQSELDYVEAVCSETDNDAMSDDDLLSALSE